MFLFLQPILLHSSNPPVLLSHLAMVVQSNLLEDIVVQSNLLEDIIVVQSNLPEDINLQQQGQIWGGVLWPARDLQCNSGHPINLASRYL
ncbi:hypothetical protein M8J75_008721 [Diaphorina citri]|nr:hypothetical protein M8J75_008721 [Diaphorina citri]